MEPVAVPAPTHGQHHVRVIPEPHPVGLAHPAVLLAPVPVVVHPAVIAGALEVGAVGAVVGLRREHEARDVVGVRCAVLTALDAEHDLHARHPVDEGGALEHGRVHVDLRPGPLRDQRSHGPPTPNPAPGRSPSPLTPRLRPAHPTRAAETSVAFPTSALWAHSWTREVEEHDATVVDVTDGSLLPKQTVLVEGNRIVAVGPEAAVRVPDKAVVVEAAGRYLIPGLWDMHVHIFNQVSRRPPNTWYFPLFIANGVTGVRDMWTKPENMQQVREWRSSGREGRLLAPRIAAVGTIVDGPAGAAPQNFGFLALGPHVDVVGTAAQARAFGRRVKAAGIDFVKTYSNLSRGAYFAIADEAKREDIPFAGHVPFVVDAAEASVAGQRSFEHLFQILESSSSKSGELFAVPLGEWSSKYDKLMLDTFDETKFRELVAVLAKNRTYQVPTLVTRRISDRRTPRRWLRYVPAEEMASWNQPAPTPDDHADSQEESLGKRLLQEQLEVVRRMRQAGVPFLAGTDVGNPYIVPGFSLHEELALLVEAGFSPLQALQTATVNSARFLDLSDSLGRVEEGKIADLVLLDANPLEDIHATRQIRAVIVNGRFLDREQRDRLLADAEAYARAH